MKFLQIAQGYTHLSSIQITLICLPLPDDPGDPTRSLPAWVLVSPPGVVHDGVEPMCDGQHRAGLKLGADGSLDEVVCLQVNGCRGLI